MRISVLGNSHIAAFKLGWDEIKSDYPDIEMTFFGSPTTSMRFFRVEEEHLVPTTDSLRDNLIWTSGGQDRIPGNQDAYILVGLGFSFIHLLDLLKNHRPPSEYDPSDETQQLISESFFCSAMEGTLRNSNALQLVGKLRQISSAPVGYAPNPYGTSGLLISERHSHFQRTLIRNRIFDYYRAKLGEMFTEADVRVIEQPEETIENRMFTASEYSKGSIKLKRGMSSPHNDDDYFHMNAAFGVLSLRDMLSHLL